MKSIALQQLDCVAQTMHRCTVFWVSYFAQGNAEALDRWGGKTKHRMISYFISNTSAKWYRNRIVYVKIIAQVEGGTFFETRCNIQKYIHRRHYGPNSLF